MPQIVQQALPLLAICVFLCLPDVRHEGTRPEFLPERWLVLDQVLQHLGMLVNAHLSRSPSDIFRVFLMEHLQHRSRRYAWRDSSRVGTSAGI